jgi:phage recombination protein Bet
MTSSALTHWTPEQTQLISSTIAPGCSQDELRLFAYACQRTGLDPFSKQIYAIKRGGRMTVQAGIDGLRSIAERTGQLDGSTTYWCGEDGQWQDVWLQKTPPSAAKTVVYRKGSAHPFVGIAVFKDYNTGQNLWTKMPSVMIGKCSESQALRRAFPADLSGVYTNEEIQQSDVEDVTVTAAPVAPPALPAQPAGDAKLFQAGKAAIAKADTLEKLAEVNERMRARQSQLSPEQYDELSTLAMQREAALHPEVPEEDPFADD